jgi:hypothetical protein
MADLKASFVSEQLKHQQQLNNVEVLLHKVILHNYIMMLILCIVASEELTHELVMLTMLSICHYTLRTFIRCSGCMKLCYRAYSIS